jgi:hypothetical protein
MKMVPKNVIPAEAGIQEDPMECIPPMDVQQYET